MLMVYILYLEGKDYQYELTKSESIVPYWKTLKTASIKCFRY